MRKLFVIAFILLVQFGYAQREANIWHFGGGAGLDFNSCEPEVIYSDIISSEGCTSIADVAGELQFYTEGSTIWNRNHEIMSNGRDLLGHRSATQSAMIIKRPGNFNEFYVFTIDEIGKSNGLMYSVVDMDGDGGLGEVTSKNASLVAPIVEKIHAVRHENGEDVWVSVHGFESSNFYSFLVTAAGVVTTPVTSSVGPFISGTELATIGAMKFSHNGKKLAICNYEHGVSLFDFDTSSGLFSNSVEVTSRLYSYGVEFSKSNNLLYVSTSYLDEDNKLLQYDLRAPIPQNSETVLIDLADLGGIGSLQMGPDHKLYVSIRGRDYLSIINEPDKLGVSCNFVEDALDLGGGTAKAGLPLFLSPIFHDEMLVEETCFGDMTSFRLSKTIDAITWDFGDPDSGINNTSTEIEPLHIFSAPGTYTITTNIPANCGPTPTITKEIIVSGAQTSTAIQLVQCDDDTDGFSFFNLNEADAKLSSDDNLTAYLYYKTKEEAQRRENSISQASSYENVIPNSDSVWVSVENNTGCHEIIEVNLIVSVSDVFATIESIVFDSCDDALNDGITIFDLSTSKNTIKDIFSGQTIHISYFRNLEDALSESNVISEISSYENIDYPYAQDIYVRVDDELNNDCLGIANLIRLTVKKQPQFELDPEVDFCLADSPTLTLAAFEPDDVYDYVWTDATGNIISTNIDATVNEGGTFTLVATSSNGCSSFPIQVDVIEFKKIEITSNMISIDEESDNNIISIDETQLGTGNYEYTLDNEFGDYQETPFFENVTTGDHTIYIREKNKCKPSSIEISVIGFPKFFTPNNDAHNDLWNLQGLSDSYSSNSKVSIFDRYGNFIKQLNPLSKGWDGTFNGKKSTPSDYWFRAELINAEGEIRNLQGHFSLIR